MILHTTVLGKGEPLLFLHTGLQTGLTDFEYQREYFKGNYQVILPDLRGHGKSKIDNIVNFFEDSVVDLVETLDDLQIDSAHIVGCSLGGLVGLIFAKRFPDRVKSLTISGVLPEKPHNWAEMQSIEAKNQLALLENEEVVHYLTVSMVPIGKILFIWLKAIGIHSMKQGMWWISKDQCYLW